MCEGDGMEEWKECKLGDIVEIHRGASPRPIQKFIATSGMPWVKISDATASNSRFINSTKEFIIEDGISKSVIVNPEDLIVSNSATPGLPKIMKIKACIHDGWLYFSNYKNISRDFLYYKFFDIQKHLTNLANGSVFQNLKTDIVKDFTIKLPPLPIQQKIATILSSIDDKIELNNKINTNLEQQTQALFKNWFVDFEPFGGKMPEGWKVGKLSDIAEITMGQSPDGKSYNEDGIGTVFYQGRAEFGTRFPTRRLFTTEPKRIAKKFDTLMSVRAPVGDTNIANEDCCIGRGLAAIHSKDRHQSFVHYTVVFLRPQLDVFNGEGTVFGCINRDALNNMEVIIPSKTDLDKFEQIVSTFDIEIFNRSEENDRLKNIRDTLLPKLMNGEIVI